MIHLLSLCYLTMDLSRWQAEDAVSSNNRVSRKRDREEEDDYEWRKQDSPLLLHSPVNQIDVEHSWNSAEKKRQFWAQKLLSRNGTPSKKNPPFPPLLPQGWECNPWRDGAHRCEPKIQIRSAGTVQNHAWGYLPRPPSLGWDFLALYLTFAKGATRGRLQPDVRLLVMEILQTFPHHSPRS